MDRPQPPPSPRPPSTSSCAGGDHTSAPSTPTALSRCDSTASRVGCGAGGGGDTTSAATTPDRSHEGARAHREERRGRGRGRRVRCGPSSGTAMKKKDVEEEEGSSGSDIDADDDDDDEDGHKKAIYAEGAGVPIPLGIGGVTPPPPSFTPSSAFLLPLHRRADTAVFADLVVAHAHDNAPNANVANINALGAEEKVLTAEPTVGGGEGKESPMPALANPAVLPLSAGAVSSPQQQLRGGGPSRPQSGSRSPPAHHGGGAGDFALLGRGGTSHANATSTSSCNARSQSPPASILSRIGSARKLISSSSSRAQPATVGHKAQDILTGKGGLGGEVGAYFDDDFTPPSTPRCGGSESPRAASMSGSVVHNNQSRGSFQFVRAPPIAQRAPSTVNACTNSNAAMHGGIYASFGGDSPSMASGGGRHSLVAQQYSLPPPPPLLLPAPPQAPPQPPPLTSAEATIMDVLFSIASRGGGGGSGGGSGTPSPSTSVSSRSGAGGGTGHSNAAAASAVGGGGGVPRVHQEEADQVAASLRQHSWHGCPPRCRYACWCVMTEYWTAGNLVASLLIGNGADNTSSNIARNSCGSGGGAEPLSPLSAAALSSPPTAPEPPQLPTLNHGALPTRLRRVTEYKTMLRQSYDVVNWGIVLGGGGGGTFSAGNPFFSGSTNSPAATPRVHHHQHQLSFSSSTTPSAPSAALLMEERREMMARVSSEEIAMMKQIRKDIPRTSVGGQFNYHTAGTSAVPEEVMARSAYLWTLLTQGQQLSSGAMGYTTNGARYRKALAAYSECVASLKADHAAQYPHAASANAAAAAASPPSAARLRGGSLALSGSVTNVVESNSYVVNNTSFASGAMVVVDNSSGVFGSQHQQPRELNLSYSSSAAPLATPQQPSAAVGTAMQQAGSSNITFSSSSVIDRRLSYVDMATIQQQQAFSPLFRHANVQLLLQRVLYMWSLRHPACGYVQGMNDLLVPIVVTVLAEGLHYALLPQQVVRQVVILEEEEEEGEQKDRVVGGEEESCSSSSPSSPAIDANGCAQSSAAATAAGPRFTPATLDIPTSANGDAELHWLTTACVEDLTVRMVQRGLLRPSAEAANALAANLVVPPPQTAGGANGRPPIIVTRAMLASTGVSITATNSVNSNGGGAFAPTSLWFALEADMYALFTRLMDTIQVNFTADAMLKKDDGGSDARARGGGGSSCASSSDSAAGKSVPPAPSPSPSAPEVATTAGSMHAMVSQLEDIVRRARPDIHSIITEHLNIKFTFFAFKWMNCMLQREMSPSTMGMRLLDTYLSEYSNSAAGTTASSGGGLLGGGGGVGGGCDSTSAGKSSTAILNYHCYVCASLLIHVYGPILTELITNPKGVPLPPPPPPPPALPAAVVPTPGATSGAGLLGASSNRSFASDGVVRNYSFAGTVVREEDTLSPSLSATFNNNNNNSSQNFSNIKSGNLSASPNKKGNTNNGAPTATTKRSFFDAVADSMRGNKSNSNGNGGGGNNTNTAAAASPPSGGSRINRLLTSQNASSASMAGMMGGGGGAVPPIVAEPLKAPPAPPRIDLDAAEDDEKDLLSSAVLSILQNPALFLNFNEIVANADALGLRWAGLPPATAEEVQRAEAEKKERAERELIALQQQQQRRRGASRVLVLSTSSPTDALVPSFPKGNGGGGAVGANHPNAATFMASRDDVNNAIINSDHHAVRSRSSSSIAMGGGVPDAEVTSLVGGHGDGVDSLTGNGGGGGGGVSAAVRGSTLSPTCVSPIATSAAALAAASSSSNNHRLPPLPAGVGATTGGSGLNASNTFVPSNWGGLGQSSSDSSSPLSPLQRGADPMLQSPAAAPSLPSFACEYATPNVMFLIKRRFEEVLSEAFVLQALYQNSPAQLGAGACSSASATAKGGYTLGGGGGGYSSSNNGFLSGKGDASGKPSLASSFASFVDSIGKSKSAANNGGGGKPTAAGGAPLPPLAPMANRRSNSGLEDPSSSAPSSTTTAPTPNKKDKWLNNWFGKKP